MTDQSSVDAAAKAAHDAYGLVDLVINNAGAMLPNPLTEGRLDEWTRMIDTKPRGSRQLCETHARSPETEQRARSATFMRWDPSGGQASGKY
ncbi:SDR family NAD(P)-dependent oxidoreductase [Planomonospora sphaerica]|uniref:SDR family NAD(P)-dependent oxidoreductase n=1 Tax=Planomonospora sphaerica TaxID=161355 RepID=UPI0009FCFB3E